ncbi:uncharacterized protein LOC144062880 [Vanacampus margaritifer]
MRPARVSTQVQMEKQQVEEQQPMNEPKLGEAAGGHPGAFKLRARIRRAAALIGALLLGAVVTAAVLLLSFNVRNQDAEAEISRVKVNVTRSIQKSDGQGRHHIFTVDRAATYLIYGWLAFSPDSASRRGHAKEDEAEVVVLKQTLNRSEMDIQTKPRASEVFFFEKMKMVDHSMVSVHFSGQHVDSCFHIYEI